MPCRGFRSAPSTLNCARAPVAQLDRALRFERSGRRFESVRAHQTFCTPKYRNLQLIAKWPQFEPPTDKKPVRQLGRLRPSWTLPRSGGGPERSGGRAAQPRAIRPGAPFIGFIDIFDDFGPAISSRNCAVFLETQGRRIEPVRAHQQQVRSVAAASRLAEKAEDPLRELDRYRPSMACALLKNFVAIP
jgi:hypothetical protein